MTPFRSKAAIKRAMVPGSRWAMDNPTRDPDIAATAITFVRASSTSRWFRFDDGPASGRPIWWPLSNMSAWKVLDDGLVETDTGVRLRLITEPESAAA